MSARIHIDLLKAGEHGSASMVRASVMIPATCLLLVIATLLFALSRMGNLLVIDSQISNIKTDIALAQSAYKSACEQKQQLAILNESLSQMKRFESAHTDYSALLDSLIDMASKDVQIQSLTMTSPQPYVLDMPISRSRSKVKIWGQPNETEPVQMSFSGRTTSADPINHLMSTLCTGDTKDLVTDAVIPRGAFRLDEYSKKSNLMRFTVDCTLTDRSYTCQ